MPAEIFRHFARYSKSSRHTISGIPHFPKPGLHSFVHSSFPPA